MKDYPKHEKKYWWLKGINEFREGKTLLPLLLEKFSCLRENLKLEGVLVGWEKVLIGICTGINWLYCTYLK